MVEKTRTMTLGNCLRRPYYASKTSRHQILMSMGRFNAVFPNLLSLHHPIAEKWNLRYPVANPFQFALSFDDIWKKYFE